MTLLPYLVETVDPLSQVLERFRWSTTDHQEMSVGRGERRRFRDGSVRLFSIARGDLELTDTLSSVTLHAGDFLLVPRDREHAVRALGEVVMMTASLELDSPSAAQLLDRVPGFVLARSLGVTEPAVVALLQALSLEARARRPGSAAVISHLVSAVATAALRAWIESGCGYGDILTIAVHHPQVASAVSAIHAEPGRAWSVEALARIAHTSRSAFVQRFREMAGEPPARYVARVRIGEAKRMLEESPVSVSQVAANMGYASDAAFSRAFRRIAGTSPTEWRRPRVAALPRAV